MEIVHLNKASFDKLTKQTEKAVLIDFWAEWCGPCQMLAPVLEEIAAAHDDLIVGKVNVDDNPELAAALSIYSIPAMFFYRNGKLEQQLVGYMTKDAIEQRIGL